MRKSSERYLNTRQFSINEEPMARRQAKGTTRFGALSLRECDARGAAVVAVDRHLHRASKEILVRKPHHLNETESGNHEQLRGVVKREDVI
jgi:hypothetical protein